MAEKESRIIEFLLKFKTFLRNFIHPFLAPFFTVMNYFSLVDSPKLRWSTWGIAFLILSIVYFLVSLGFAIYQVAKNIKA